MIVWPFNEIAPLSCDAPATKRRGELLLQLKAEGRLKEGKRKLSSGNDSLQRHPAVAGRSHKHRITVGGGHKVATCRFPPVAVAARP